MINWKKPLEAITPEGFRAPARVLGAISWRGESQVTVAISGDDGEEVQNVRQNGEIVLACSWSHVENVPLKFKGFVPVSKSGPGGLVNIGPFHKTEQECQVWAQGHWGHGKYFKAVPVSWEEE